MLEWQPVVQASMPTQESKVDFDLYSVKLTYRTDGLIEIWRENHLSNDQKPGWLGYIEGIIQPSYMGIVVGHYKNPESLLTNQYTGMSPGF